MSDFNVETKCLHSGYTPSKGEPCALPICQSTTYKYDTTDEMGQLFDLKAEGYFYTRLQNPTNDAVAAKIADLEGGVAAILTSSGQAANFYAVFNICEAGDHVVAASTIYGGTFNLLAVTFKKLGIDCTFVDTDASPEEIAAAFRPNTKVLFAETIANPALVILDIEKFAKVAHEHEVPLIVDNTFRIVLYSALGLLTLDTVKSVLLLIPFALLGLYAGIKCSSCMDEKLVRKITSVLLVLSGISLILKNL